MKPLQLIFLLLYLSSDAFGQISIGADVLSSTHYPFTVERNDPEARMKVQHSATLSYRLFARYQWKPRISFSAGLLLRRFPDEVTWDHSGLDLSPSSIKQGSDQGLYYMGDLAFSYSLIEKKRFSFKINPGAAVFCNHCSSTRFYLANNKSTKPDQPGIYYNGWEARYNPGLNLYMHAEVSAEFTFKSHSFGFLVDFGQALRWNQEFIIRSSRGSPFTKQLPERYNNYYLTIRNQCRSFQYGLRYRYILKNANSNK